MSFPLTQAVYDAVVTSPCLYASLQFMPEGDIAILESSDTCEIGFSKKTYLALFTEAHCHFLQHSYDSYTDIKSLSSLQLESLYMATNCFLISTNEYTTVWTLHQQAVGELYVRNGIVVLEKEFRFCLALCTSRLARINKSLSLWYWVRKLTVMVVLHGHHLFADYVQHVLRSMELHFANYCAGYTLAWLVEVWERMNIKDQVLQEGLLDNPILQLVRDACRRNLHDISLWNTLACVLQRRRTPYAIVHYRDICMQMSSVLQENIEPRTMSDCNHSGEQDNECMDDLQWLLAVECKVASPYRCILASMQNFNPGISLITDKMNILGSGSFYDQLNCILAEFRKSKQTKKQLDEVQIQRAAAIHSVNAIV